MATNLCNLDAKKVCKVKTNGLGDPCISSSLKTNRKKNKTLKLREKETSLKIPNEFIYQFTLFVLKVEPKTDLVVIGGPSQFIEAVLPHMAVVLVDVE